MSKKKKIAILQSNYIPWKGYFDLINGVDEFIFYDDVQFTKNDWRNRNIIKTKDGPAWLTIPVIHNSLSQKIKDTKIVNKYWAKKHWKSILGSYSKAKYFKNYAEIFESIYLNMKSNYLCDVNYAFIEAISAILGIITKISKTYSVDESKNKLERLISICKSHGATHYLTGPSAKNYIDEKLFISENIMLEYVDYLNYPSYTQLFGEFVHEVTILDLIFNEGTNSIGFMKSFNQKNKN